MKVYDEDAPVIVNPSMTKTLRMMLDTPILDHDRAQRMLSREDRLLRELRQGTVELGGKLMSFGEAARKTARHMDEMSKGLANWKNHVHKGSGGRITVSDQHGNILETITS